MKRTAMVGLLALASWSAQAGHEAPDWHVGAAASFTDFQGDDVADPALGTDFIDDGAVGVKLFTQYQFNKWFGIEGAYHNSGDLEDLSSDQSSKLEISFSGFSAQGVLYLPLPTEEIQPYVKAGYFDFDDELTVDGNTTSNASESGLVAGAGAFIAIADNFGIRADLDWFDAEVGTLWSVNLGLEYYFGGPKKAEPVAVVAADEPPPPPPPAAPADADGDGVTDEADQCPDTPQGDRVGPFGCSCDVSRQVEFGFDSAELTDAGKATLDEVAETLTRLKFVEGTVEGHTDSEGEADYNLGLSERRAQAVADYLQAKGVASGRLTAQGLGESQPIADNETAEGRAQNRRVVLRRTDCNAAE